MIRVKTEMEMVLADLNKCCRCCLAMVNAMKPIFGACLNDMLREVMNLQIARDDGYPQQMCARCVLKLSSAYTFQTMVMKNQKTLEEKIKSVTKDGKLSTVDSCEERKDLKEEVRKTMEVDINESERGRMTQVPQEDFNSPKTMTKQNTPIETTSTILESAQGEGFDREDYQCSQCEHNSENLEALEVHLQTHLVGSKDISKTHIDTCAQLCNICGARFHWRTSLHKHLRQHRNRYRCEVCQKVFGEASTLNTHMVCHSLIPKPFECTTCGRSFTQQSSLRKHALTHDARSQLHCNDCDKTFLHKFSLLRHHESAHSPNECPLCKNTFEGKKLFEAHMKLHNRKMDDTDVEMLIENTVTDSVNIQSVTVEFLCLICSQKFQGKESLEVHVCDTDKITEKNLSVTFL